MTAKNYSDLMTACGASNISEHSSGLPPWAKPLKSAHSSDGFVDNDTQLEFVLELHCRACLLDHVKR